MIKILQKISNSGRDVQDVRFLFKKFQVVIKLNVVVAMIFVLCAYILDKLRLELLNSGGT